jgi:hypothetical protein
MKLLRNCWHNIKGKTSRLFKAIIMLVLLFAVSEYLSGAGLLSESPAGLFLPSYLMTTTFLNFLLAILAVLVIICK